MSGEVDAKGTLAAEPKGTLPADTYAIMVRVGGKNVFYAEP